MVSKYRKKAIEIEACRFNGDIAQAIDIVEWIDKYGSTAVIGTNAKTGTNEIVIPTLEGDMTASSGDYIIKGIEDEFYPCKPSIFIDTYERILT